MLSPQTSYHYNQTVGIVAKLDMIRITGHLTVGVFYSCNTFTVDKISRIVSYFL